MYGVGNERRGVAAATKSVQVLNMLSLNSLEKKDGNGLLLTKSDLEGKLQYNMFGYVVELLVAFKVAELLSILLSNGGI